MLAYFYLFADDIRPALDMTLEKMKDINLTICLLRLVNSKYENDYGKNFILLINNIKIISLILILLLEKSLMVF